MGKRFNSSTQFVIFRLIEGASTNIQSSSRNCNEMADRFEEAKGVIQFKIFSLYKVP